MKEYKMDLSGLSTEEFKKVNMDITKHTLSLVYYFWNSDEREGSVVGFEFPWIYIEEDGVTSDDSDMFFANQQAIEITADEFLKLTTEDVRL